MVIYRHKDRRQGFLASTKAHKQFGFAVQINGFVSLQLADLRVNTVRGTNAEFERQVRDIAGRLLHKEANFQCLLTFLSLFLLIWMSVECFSQRVKGQSSRSLKEKDVPLAFGRDITACSQYPSVSFSIQARLMDGNL